MVVFAGRAFAQTPRPQQAQRQEHQRRDIGRRCRIGFARLAQTGLQLLGTRTLQTAAVAAQRDITSFADPQRIDEALGKLLPQSACQGPQHVHWQPNQRHLESLECLAWLALFLMTRDVESSCRGKALAFRIATTPGHGQQDPKHRLHCPARSRLCWSPSLMDLLPNLGCEKLSDTSAKRNRSPSHEPFLLEGWVVHPPFWRETAFSAAQLGGNQALNLLSS